ncbi:Multidrug transporter EmrE [Paracoccus aminovorans]|uniref:Multidrug transporter EmrE n=1 Tax=Paracoccus aminovorans TaxID=34004 RepID=A0A1I2YX21_9RHOB|nr:SMR family transporter [Paracoccus aminovorans]CQR85830.1 putative membrane protein [Paracoccus aminovorans]SFH30164.1 Multidrug transporter EmrE [Paracoccus aminovorans]
MSLTAFATVLFAAALHAGWNAIVKGGRDKLLSTALIAVFASAIAAAALPFLAQPAPASWPYILGSVLLQCGYFVLVARIYHVADMSLAYPVMRGAAPLLVALASIILLHESLSPPAVLGIAIICAGVLGMAAAGRGGDSRGLPLALLNAVVIASYTLVDGVGVRLSGAPAGYAFWIFLLTGLPFLAWALARRRQDFAAYLARHARTGLIGGIGTSASYGLALWAMTLAPVATVSALRETSILFGTAISGLVLHERLGRNRIAAAGLIAAGAMVLRLG